MSQPIIQGTSPYTLLITVETINFRGNKAPKAENEQMSALPMKTPETRVDFEKQQRQQRARIILDHYELLIQYAIENDKSVPQTRAYFEKVSLGIPTQPIIKNWFPNDA